MQALDVISTTYAAKFAKWGLTASYASARGEAATSVNVLLDEKGSDDSGRYAVVVCPRADGFSPRMGGVFTVDGAEWEIKDWHEGTNRWQYAFLCATNRRPAA